MILKFIAPVLVVVPLTTSADVNMRDASFVQTAQDFSNSISSRTYSSRSLWKGLFGFGWCAQFEKSLRIQTSTTGTLSECDRSRSVAIQFRNGLWQVHRKDKSMAAFNSQGKMTEYRSPENLHSRLRYDSNGRLISIDFEKTSLQFFYDSQTSELKEIRQAKKLSMTYEFKNDDLMAVLGPKQHIKYLYDQNHNLIEIRNGKKREKIQYKDETDEVAAFENSNGCKETYHFQKVTEFEYKSWATRTCAKAPPVGRTYSFKSQRTPQGSLILTEVRSSGGIHDKGILP